MKKYKGKIAIGTEDSYTKSKFNHAYEIDWLRSELYSNDCLWDLEDDIIYFGANKKYDKYQKYIHAYNNKQ